MIYCTYECDSMFCIFLYFNFQIFVVQEIIFLEYLLSELHFCYKCMFVFKIENYFRDCFTAIQFHGVENN